LPGRTRKAARGKTKSTKRSSRGPKAATRKRRGGKAAKKVARGRIGRAARKSTRTAGGKGTKKAAGATARKAAKRSTKPKSRSSQPRGVSRGRAHGPAGKPKQAKAEKVAQARVMQSKARVEELRAMLEAKRAEVLDEIKRAREDSVTTDQTSFPEVGDLVSASVEKERAFEYGEAGVHALREINAALEKLKEGTYGICEICGKAIGIKRLKVMPSARLCIKCKSKEEASAGATQGR
jgi:DnaK suppressor protein